jgi:ssDNA-binding Zn-finger/Zn-ribbon topoisomerase 1
MTQTLCQSCSHKKEIVSGKGSRFLLCQLSQTDRHYPKYPPQPVVKCSGYTRAIESQE